MGGFAADRNSVVRAVNVPHTSHRHLRAGVLVLRTALFATMTFASVDLACGSSRAVRVLPAVQDGSSDSKFQCNLLSPTHAGMHGEQ